MTVLAPMVVLACVLSACGSGAPDSSEPSALSGVNGGSSDVAASGNSYPLPDCTGQDPKTCSYDGFDPMVDGFSFANWGETGKLGATGLIALFGESKVCATVTSRGCVLYPAAKEWADQVNEQMARGHCEGMAVMAARLFRGDLTPQALDPAAESTFDLVLADPDVESAIDTWWATQLLAPVQEAYLAFQKYRPSAIAAELAAGLQRGDGYTMGIYSPAGAHAITPFAVTREGNRIAISVYDNNFPGTVQRIMIDPAAERWSYAMGSTNPDEPTGGWEGGTGTIELTPMSSRALPSIAPFDDAPAKGVARGNSATTHLLLTSPDPQARTSVVLTIDGRTYDTSDPTVVLPDGVLVRSTLGAVLSGEGTTVAVDRSKVKSFSASPRATGGTSGSTPFTMSADAVGAPRSTVRAVASTGEPTGQFVVDRRGKLTIDSGDWTDAEVNIANGLNSVDFPLDEDLDMAISTDDDGVADVELLDEDGNVIGEYAVDDETEDGMVMDSTAEFDAETGEFDVTEEEAEPEDVDEDVLEWLADMSDDNGSEDSDEASDESMDMNDADDGDSAGSEDSDDASSGDDEGTDSDADSDADADADADADSGSDADADADADSGSDADADADAAADADPSE
jgi:hypothetical protein